MVLVVEVVANLSAHSPHCCCYFIFSTNQLIVFCVKQALRGGVFTINLHVSFQKKCEFTSKTGGSNLMILISCYVVGRLRFALNHSVLLDFVGVFIPTLICLED